MNTSKAARSRHNQFTAKSDGSAKDSAALRERNDEASGPGKWQPDRPLWRLKTNLRQKERKLVKLWAEINVAQARYTAARAALTLLTEHRDNGARLAETEAVVREHHNELRDRQAAYQREKGYYDKVACRVKAIQEARRLLAHRASTASG